ncbi:hypothetical protein D8674_008242 [Pyrus ussuriensis x Pyrus communis]|uniref:Uncharacterized protein n=1 Tax=Pyrus ussuriensis x Pyrus communis TaxID=2448454 RepID=A0A5N5HVA9_9ROSA|nr:hypothetical protein D8674_008242 [Pyrus ussuriensis x Pyrus communis]
MVTAAPACPTHHRHPLLMPRGHNKTVKITRVTNGHITIGYNDWHRDAPTMEHHSTLAHDIGHVVRTYCPMQWKSWKVMPDEVRTKVRAQLSTNYNFEDINNEMLAYVNKLFSERYKQWKSDLHQYFETFDDSQVAFEEGCPKEFEGREDNWAWLCTNKSNREKKTLLHHYGSRPFSYRMEAGSKFPGIDVFSDIYLRPGDELAKCLHATMMEKRQLVLQESTSQLPPETLLESGHIVGGRGMLGGGNLEPLHYRNQRVR